MVGLVLTNGATANGILGTGGLTPDPFMGQPQLPPPPPPPGAGTPPGGAVAAVAVGGLLAGYAIGTQFYNDAAIPGTVSNHIAETLVGWIPFQSKLEGGRSTGGGEVQSSIPAVTGQPGKVAGVQYRIYLNDSGGHVCCQGNFTGPVSGTKFTDSVSGYPRVCLHVTHSGGATDLYGFVGAWVDQNNFTLYIERLDGTTSATDQAQDPNARPGSAGVSSEGNSFYGGTYGPSTPPLWGQVGGGGSSTPIPGGSTQNPSPIPSGSTPSPYPGGPPGWVPFPTTTTQTPIPQPPNSTIGGQSPSPIPGGSTTTTTTQTPQGGYPSTGGWISPQPPTPTTNPDPTPINTTGTDYRSDPTGFVPIPWINLGPNPTGQPGTTDNTTNQTGDTTDQLTAWLQGTLQNLPGGDTPSNRQLLDLLTSTPPSLYDTINPTPRIPYLFIPGMMQGQTLIQIDPRTGQPIQTQPQTQTPQAPPPVGTPNPTPSTCQYPGYHGSVMGGHTATQTSVGAVNTLISGTTNVMVAEANTGINAIKTSIGTPITGAANTIFGAINDIQLWGEKFSKSLYLDRVYNALGLLLQIHNAAMLSRSLVDSISFLIDSAMSILHLKNEKDEQLDVNSILGQSIENLIKSAIGADVYNGLSRNWKKLSAIYTSAVNIYELTLNSMAGIAEGLETASSYTGKIGNALKKGGVVFETAYQWMDENVRVKTGRFAAIQNFTDGLQNATEITDNLTEVTSQIQETTENVVQIQSEFDKVKASVHTEETKIAGQAATSRTVSQTPTINRPDMLNPNQ